MYSLEYLGWNTDPVVAFVTSTKKYRNNLSLLIVTQTVTVR